ncbi:ABC transporter permease subunit [Halomarina salina]|uniref:ABC transporter permease subunit n=1 Tax=Halomarina salina TaxID=1872699 RepID=A0ABD5RMX4_9EURY|nr:ABC transporter permease subunit [Halomarina salina]
MSGWQSVARKDFNDALRSRRLLTLVVAFVLFVVGTEYLLVEVLGGDVTSADALVGSLVGPTVVLVPLIGLVTGYRSIAGERETGSHKLLLSLPHSRRDVVLGKLLGRSLVVGVAIVAGFVAGGLLAFGLIGGYEVTPFVLYFLVTLLYATAFVALGVGISAVTGSTSVAVMASFGAFVLFQFLWLFVVGLVRTELFPNASAAVFEVTLRLSPLISYGVSLDAFVMGGAGGPEFYQGGWFALFVLVCWVVVPPALGYLRFRSVDL